MPASSIPIGPIIFPTLLSVLTIGAGKEMCNRYKSAPATIAIRLTLVRIFFHSNLVLPCRQALAWVQSKINCTMTKAQEYTTYSLPSKACTNGITNAAALL